MPIRIQYKKGRLKRKRRLKKKNGVINGNSKIKTKKKQT